MKNMLAILLITCCQLLMAQDIIYTRKGTVLEGTVAEVSRKETRYKLKKNDSGPVYVIETNKIDSIVYSNGYVDRFYGIKVKHLNQNIPQKNTCAADAFGFTSFSITQWYERRILKDRIGLRIPLYLCYGSNGAPGMWVIWAGAAKIGGILGFNFATGLNPKFYLNNHRNARVFIGPEFTLGYSTISDHEEMPVSGYHNPSLRDNGYYKIERNTTVEMGNFASLAVIGLCINIADKGNITFETGTGYNVWWGEMENYDHMVWRIGLSFGRNF